MTLFRPTFALLLAVLFVSGCGRRDDYSSFEGAINRIYIEDGSGGLILFTPHGDWPPINNTYVYNDLDYVYVKIKSGWVEIYVPGHRTKYVLPESRVVRIDRIIPKEQNEVMDNEVSRLVDHPDLRIDKKQ